MIHMRGMKGMMPPSPSPSPSPIPTDSMKNGGTEDTASAHMPDMSMGKRKRPGTTKSPKRFSRSAPPESKAGETGREYKPFAKRSSAKRSFSKR